MIILKRYLLFGVYEIAYVYHALNEQGYKKESVLQWIDKIRQYGMDSCFVKRVRKASEQVFEIQTILEEIDKYLKRIY